MSSCATSGIETDTETTGTTTETAETAEAPGGLDTIELPDDADVIADVLAAMPDEIDGVARDIQNVVTFTEDGGRHLQLSVMEIADFQGASGGSEMTVVDFLSEAAESDHVEAVESELDDSQPLVWLTSEQTGDTGPEGKPDAPNINIANWGHPDGEWVFTAIADTAEARSKLIRAFVDATSGIETDTETTGTTTETAETAEAPGGLDTIELPDDADVIADVLAAMPDEIDGVARDIQNVVTFTEDGGRHLQLSVMEIADFQGASGGSEMTVVDFLSEAAESDHVESVESELDDSQPLVWLTADEARGDGGLLHVASWGLSDGEWIFSATADTPEARSKLIAAFVDAVQSTN